MKRRHTKVSAEAGFSLIELMVAMGITLIIMVIAGNLIAASFGIRSRETRRSDAVDDVQRALNIMTREIANSGYALPHGLTYTPPAGARAPVPANGLLPGLCDAQNIAFVSNLNYNAGANNVVTENEEGILYRLFRETTAPFRSFIVRRDLQSGNVQVLANRVDGLTIDYYDPGTGTWGATASASTTKVRLNVSITLPAVGTPNTTGYQPPSQSRLVSEIALRNGFLDRY